MAAETTTACDELQPWLAAYALGEAEPEPDALAHLVGCLRCQQDLAEYRAGSRAAPLCRLPQHEPAPALRARLIAAVEQAAPAPHTNIAPAPPTPLRRPRWQPASRSACCLCVRSTGTGAAGLEYIAAQPDHCPIRRAELPPPDLAKAWSHF
ncbi:MAG: hypothetical protein U0074_05100 [Kouleothrix sp.]